MKVILVNDTSLWNHHFGCQLAGQTFREQFSRVGLRLIGSFPLEFDAQHSLFAEADLVVVNGEGSVHNSRNRHLLELAGKYPSVFVNAVFQNDPDPSILKDFLYVSVRDHLSAEETRLNSIKVTPDVTFASSLLHSFIKGNPVNEMGFTDNNVAPDAGFSVKVPMVPDYLRTLSSYKRLCIGRFHAAVAASILEIPFSTWPSNTHKMEALMEEMGVPHLHASSQSAAKRICPREFDPVIREFVSSARLRVSAMFDEISKLKT